MMLMGLIKKMLFPMWSFSEPALVERVIRLSPEGEKFLKENDPPKINSNFNASLWGLISTLAGFGLFLIWYLLTQ